MDNGENSEENEYGSSDQHSFYSDGRDESYEPPPEHSASETERMTDRASRLCARQHIRASQDTLYVAIRSNLNDDRDRVTSSSDDYEDNIPLA